MKTMNIRRSIRHLQRYREILKIFVKYGFWDLVEKIRVGLIPEITKKILPQIERKELAALGTPLRLRMAFDELGPTFIKLGQMLSLRPDLIPPDIAQEFSKLQDEVSPADAEAIEKMLEEEYQKPVEHVFLEFNKQPVAAASMAQVHKARLRSGEEVAVKILRPNIKQIIQTDIEILSNLAQLIEKQIPESKLYDPVGIVKEFEGSIHKEQDLNLEGRNIDLFHRNMKDDPSIKTPEVFWEYSSKKILVMEFINGKKIADHEAMQAAGIDNKKIAEIGFKNILRQIFEFGFFHADPHPGNIFVLPGNIIAPIDFGMMGRIDDEMKYDLLEILRGITEKDVYRITRTLLRVGLVEASINSRALQRDLLELLDRYYGISLKQLDVAVPLNEFIELIRKHHIKLPVDLVMVGRALVISESVGIELYPEFNPFELMIPYTKKIMFKRLNPFSQYQQIARRFEQIGDLVKNFPEDLQNIIFKLKNDRLTVNFKHQGLNEFTRELDRSSNRVSFSLIIAALIIGSSLIIQIDKGPQIFGYPVLGIVGFVLASVFGLWLLISIMRSGKL